jgi:hypothetical protein
MESLFWLAFGEEEFFIACAMACSEAFFNKLLIVRSLGDSPSGQRLRVPDAILLLHLAQVLACLTLLVRVETCLNKLMVRDGK